MAGLRTIRIGVDPSYRRTGWAVMADDAENRPVLIDVGSTLDKRPATPEHALETAREVAIAIRSVLMHEAHPDVSMSVAVVIEKPRLYDSSPQTREAVLSLTFLAGAIAATLLYELAGWAHSLTIDCPAPSKHKGNLPKGTILDLVRATYLQEVNHDEAEAVWMAVGSWSAATKRSMTWRSAELNAAG